MQHFDALGGERIDGDGVVREVLDTSIEPMPSVSTRTRSPWKPRSTGRDAPG
jgi:hypothetical protein